MYHDRTPKTPERGRPALMPKSFARSDSSTYSSPGDNVFDTPSEKGGLDTPDTPPSTGRHHDYNTYDSPSARKFRGQPERWNDYFHELSEAADSTSGRPTCRASPIYTKPGSSKHSTPIAAHLPVNRALFTEAEYAQIKNRNFSTTQKELDTIVPYDVRARFSADSERCIASIAKHPGRPQCSTRFTKTAKAVRRQHIYNVDMSLQALAALITSRNHAQAFEEVDKIIEYGMCGHHTSAASTRRHRYFPNNTPLDKDDGTLWLHTISGVKVADVGAVPALKAETPRPPHFRNHHRLRKDSAVCAEERKSQHAPSNVKKEVNVKIKDDDRSIPDIPEPVRTKPQQNKKEPASRDVYVQEKYIKIEKPTPRPIHYPDFMPYQPGTQAGLTTQEAIRLSATASLSKSKDHREGFIYLFRINGNHDYVKIGYSSEPQRRLKDWRRDCNLDYHFLECWQIFGTLIPHISRVEELIHVELKEYRRSFCCSSCSLRKCKAANHVEWFDVRVVGLEFVKKVCRKWIEWMLTRPYEDKGGYWALEEQESIRFSQTRTSTSQRKEERHQRDSLTRDTPKSPRVKKENYAGRESSSMPAIVDTIDAGESANLSKAYAVSAATKQRSRPTTAQSDRHLNSSDRGERTHAIARKTVTVTLRTSAEVSQPPSETPPKQEAMRLGITDPSPARLINEQKSSSPSTQIEVKFGLKTPRRFKRIKAAMAVVRTMNRFAAILQPRRSM